MSIEEKKITTCDVCRCDDDMNSHMRFKKLHGLDVCGQCMEVVKRILRVEFEERVREERERRIYYQDIVYAVCSALDEIDGNHVSKGTGIVCGTLGSPSTEVQDRMKRLVEQHS